LEQGPRLAAADRLVGQALPAPVYREGPEHLELVPLGRGGGAPGKVSLVTPHVVRMPRGAVPRHEELLWTRGPAAGGRATADPPAARRPGRRRRSRPAGIRWACRCWWR